jgi:hypothetical protein
MGIRNVGGGSSYGTSPYFGGRQGKKKGDGESPDEHKDEKRPYEHLKVSGVPTCTINVKA